MNTVWERVESLEEELTPEPIARPAMSSLALHGGLIAALVLYGVVSGLFRHGLWGNAGLGGAMQVNLVSNTLPLPAKQVNQNVLATETPSEAPAELSPKKLQQVDEKAIPIPGRRVKPQRETRQKTQQHQPTPQQNRAAYGEQAGSVMPRATMPSMASNGPTTVGDNDFASRFGWYVDQINRTMANEWYKTEVDPRTPHGARVYLIFTVHRDGSPSNVQLDRSSGSPTLDLSCERAVQRTETFGPLPGAYNQSTLKVSYYCEY
jgi:periplasmic protein TonB